MALTDIGTQLTEVHRQRQLQVRSQTLADLLALWPAFDLADIDGTWPPVEAGLVTLIMARRRESSQIAADSYRTFRQVERIPGDVTVRPAADPDRTLLTATLRILGPIGAKKQISRGARNVSADTLTRVSGSTTRQVLEAGRETLTRTLRDDPRSRGWRRITDSDPCEFCAGLADEGVTAKTSAAGFAAHDHCGCTAEPAFT